MLELVKTTLEVTVFNSLGQRFEDAEVTLKGLEPPCPAVRLEFDSRRRAYRGDEIESGVYLLKAHAKRCVTEERHLDLYGGLRRETFYLGKRGQSFYYRGKARIPFKKLPDLLGVSLRKRLTPSQVSELEAFAHDLGLVMQAVGEPIRQDKMLLFRFTGPTPDADNVQEAQSKLQKHPFVRRVGPPIRKTDDTLAFLTNELVARFRPEIDEAEIDDIAASLQVNRRARRFTYAANTFVLTTGGLAGYDILDVCEALVRQRVVLYAEPNLVINTVNHAVTPGDFRWEHQWHLPLVELPGAWQILRDINANLTYGSDQIVIAVMDTGIQSVDARLDSDPVHPDLNGTVTSGQKKVSAFYDFERFRPGNITGDGSNLDPHGVKCAGIAAALADNDSVIPGEKEGIAGVAPNCRVMGLIKPGGADEIIFADAYSWIAGFEPGWVKGEGPYPDTADLPAKIAPAADVISTSFNKQMEVAGLMQDCFDSITTYGRGGKGVLLFFSAGNDNAEVKSLNEWAAYHKTIAVAASTWEDKRATYSNKGVELDVCAPSGWKKLDEPMDHGITTCQELSGSSGKAGHSDPPPPPDPPTPAPFDYTDHYTGTSAACPLAAGIGALVLSVKPSLTWVMARQILRDTAERIDPLMGGYINGHSQLYGYGRVNASKAVGLAEGLTPATSPDTWIRENEPDLGNVPAAMPYSSPDVWVRNLPPALDNPAQIEIHQNPLFGSNNWVYARIRNRGTNSLEVFARIHITRWAGTQYVYPDDFMPVTNPSTPPGDASQMAPGSHLIGEVHLPGVAANGVETIVRIWPANLVPPENVTIGGVTYSWADSCLLVDVSPHDGPPPTGMHTWQNNNLCQRNLMFLDPQPSDSDPGGVADMQVAFVIGHARNRARQLTLHIDRHGLPATVDLLLDYVDPQDTARISAFLLHNPGMFSIQPVNFAGRTIFLLPDATTIAPVLRQRRQYQVVALVTRNVGSLADGDYPVTVYQVDPGGENEGSVEFIIQR